MANPEHLAILNEGVSAWNEWRLQNPDTHVDLTFAQLDRRDLPRANFDEATLQVASFPYCNLKGATFRGADLRDANFFQADLYDSNFVDANLRGAQLNEAKMVGVNLRESFLNEADLSNANLRSATMVQTDLRGAKLNGCSIYGISAWDVLLDGAQQQDLNIAPAYAPPLTVDNLEVAQFIHLLLSNERIRTIIDTITSKVVLILGRFTPERKKVLDAIKAELRRCNYLPVLFDFEGPNNRDSLETVSTIAHIARFVIADVTDAKSVLHELQRIVPGLPSLPIMPLLREGEHLPGMFDHFRQFRSVLEAYEYSSVEQLTAGIRQDVILPLEHAFEERNLGRT